jgi:phage N-6-adenine-methyltransferase
MPALRQRNWGLSLKVSGGAFAVRLTDWLCSFWGIMADVKQEWFNRPKIDYETPDDIFEPLDLEFGFTLDVAAHEGNAKCKDFFTEDDNGLLQPWHGVCWMNPPFGRVMKKWVKKAFEEWKRGSTVVCLLPARTNTAWWHDWVMQGEIRFIRGEVTFKGQKNGLWMPMAIVVFRA